MATPEYHVALGENRLAFAAADYELVFLIMTLDSTFQNQVDSPKSRQDIVTSKSLSGHLTTRVSLLVLPDALVDEAQQIAADWSELSDRRNNLAHAWGFSDENGVSQLGGYSHTFIKGEYVRTHMAWSLEQLQKMTADCRHIFGRIRSWRLAFADLKR